MADDDHKKTSNPAPQDDTQQDLEDHGVKDIIPEDEEYYTLDLKRDFDDLDEDEDDDNEDLAGANPLDDNDNAGTASVYDGDVMPDVKDHRPLSSNQGGPVKEEDITDQDTANGMEVGEPGHWGIDDETG